MPALYDDEAMGKHGHDRVASGTGSPSKGKYVALKAMNADVVFGPGVEAAQGTPPAEDDVLLQGDVYIGQLDQVDVKSGGVLYAYYEKEQ
jgi:hypothetical protein